MGLGRLALSRKDWTDAEQRFNSVAENYPKSKYAPQAVYYRGVSKYSGSHDHHALGDTAKALAEKYPDSEWRQRSLPWD
jgi:TolA-binding protein